MKNAKRNRKKKVIEVILTILGTAIVAVTFYIHEVKSEHLKSLSDAMAQANSIVLLREDLKNILIKLDRIDEEQLHVHKPPTQSDPAKKYLLDLEFESIGRDEFRAIALRELDEAKLLWNSTGNAAKVKKVDDLLKTEEEIRDRDRKLSSEIGNESRSDNRHVQTRKTYVERFASRAENLHKDAVDVDSKARAVLDEGLFDIGVFSEEANHSYENYKRWSYRLYSLGFVLGLVGKLVGIGDDDSGE